MTQLTDDQIIAAEKAVQAAVDRGETAPVRFAILALTAGLSASPSPQGDEVERVARAIKDVIIPTTGDPLGVTLYESEAVVGSNADEAKESLMEICCIAAEAALSALPRRETVPTLTEEERERLNQARERDAEHKQGFMDNIGEEADADRAFLLSLIDKLMGEG